ncbi:MAG: YihY/virulence factor BrkB family protein [Verrucomicrobiales bacterium]|nr:YihY/virulence factor BrkB family protein [Verrucomicrobiales bacterium]
MKWRSLWNSIRNFGKQYLGDWTRYECTTQAAAISFYAALSFFPFVVVVISGVGFFFEHFKSGQNAQETVLAALSEIFSPEMSSSVAEILGRVQTEAQVGGPIAAVMLLYLSSRVFVQLDRAFLFIWEARPAPTGSLLFSTGRLLLRRLKSVAFVLVAGIVVIVIFFGITILYAAGSFLETWLPNVGSFLGLGSHLLSVAISGLVFAVIYRILSRGPAGWWLCLRIGLVVAILWEIGRLVLASLVIGEKYTPFGLVGSFLGILVWIFYNVLALLAGAVLVKMMAGDSAAREST